MFVGAVHIALLLVPMARLAGYETTVIDPRGMFAAAARFDQPVDENWPDEALDRWRPDGGSAVVSLTHDPKLDRSEEHTPELQSLMRISYAVFCLKKKNKHKHYKK